MSQPKQIQIIRNIGNIFLSLLFVVVLVLPFFQKHFQIFPLVESTEKRQLASKPDFDITSLDGFPGKYEAWYNDYFSLRNHMVKLKSLFSLKLFKVSPDPNKIIIGKDNWLFMVPKELATYRGTDLLSASQIDTIRTQLLYRVQYFNERDIKVYFAILPTKYSVYPENLPFYVNRLRIKNQTDQFIELLDERGIPSIDLRNSLFDKKSDKLLFYKSDNHWNDLGAFIGTEAIIKRIKEDFPVVNIPDLTAYKLKEFDFSSGNLAALINMQEYFAETNLYLEPKLDQRSTKLPKFGFKVPDNFEFAYLFEESYSTGIDSLPNIIVFRDSFGNAMLPFFREQFDTTVFIFDKWKYKLNPEIIEAVKPDIVVYAILESLLEKEFLQGIHEEQYMRKDPILQKPQ